MTNGNKDGSDSDELVGDKTVVIPIQSVMDRGFAAGNITSEGSGDYQIVPGSKVEVDHSQLEPETDLPPTEEALHEGNFADSSLSQDGPEVVSITPEELSAPGFWNRLSQMVSGSATKAPIVPEESKVDHSQVKSLEETLVPETLDAVRAEYYNSVQEEKSGIFLRACKKVYSVLNKPLWGSKSNEVIGDLAQEEPVVSTQIEESVPLIDRLVTELTTPLLTPSGFEEEPVFYNPDEARSILSKYVSDQRPGDLNNILSNDTLSYYQIIKLANSIYALQQDAYAHLKVSLEEVNQSAAQLVGERQELETRVRELDFERKDLVGTKDGLVTTNLEFREIISNLEATNLQLESMRDEYESLIEQYLADRVGLTEKLSTTETAKLDAETATQRIQALLSLEKDERIRVQNELTQYKRFARDLSPEQLRDFVVQADCNLHLLGECKKLVGKSQEAYANLEKFSQTAYTELETANQEVLADLERTSQEAYAALEDAFEQYKSGAETTNSSLTTIQKNLEIELKATQEIYDALGIEFEQYRSEAESKQQELVGDLNGLIKSYEELAVEFTGAQEELTIAKKQSDLMLAEKEELAERIFNLEGELISYRNHLIAYRTNLGEESPAQIKENLDCLVEKRLRLELNDVSTSFTELKDRLGKYSGMNEEHINAELDGISERANNAEDNLANKIDELTTMTNERDEVIRRFEIYKHVDPEADEVLNKIAGLEESLKQTTSRKDSLFDLTQHQITATGKRNRIYAIAGGIAATVIAGLSVLSLYSGIENSNLGKELVQITNQKAKVELTHQADKKKTVAKHNQEIKAAETEHNSYASRAQRLTQSLKSRLDQSNTALTQLEAVSSAQSRYTSILTNGEDIGQFQNLLRTYTQNEGAVTINCATRVECGEELYKKLVSAYSPALKDDKAKELFVKQFEVIYGKTLPETFGKKIPIKMGE